MSVLAGLVGPSAQADTRLAARYPAGATGTWFAGSAFDACAAPTRTAMRAWRSSPYGAVGIYISGGQRGCDQDQLSAAWVRDVTAMGWRLLPLDVGLQAPCADNPRLRPMSWRPESAQVQGAAAATGALRAAGVLGLLPGSALYSDLENYDPWNVACAEAVRAYVSGWTRTLHASGYLAGVYSSLSSGIRGLTSSYSSGSWARPDAVWSAQWDRRPTLRGWNGVPDDLWSAHQRIKQYRGDHDEVHGGVRINIDSNVVDAPVATVAHSLPLTPGGGVPVRALPHSAAEVVDTFTASRSVPLVCRATTARGVWARLPSGRYLPDAAVAGAEKGRLPACSSPYQVVADVNLRTGPGTNAAVAGVARSGTLAWVRCETPGITLGRPGYWQQLEDGRWVSGGLLATPQRGTRSVNVPLCSR